MCDKLVVCMKWGSLYGSEYVNILANAVKAFLPHSHHVICLSDNSKGIIDGVECIPIPDLPIRKERWTHGGWPKLSVFKPGLLPQGMQALFIDLDSIILSDLSDMFLPKSGISMIKEWMRLPDYINPIRKRRLLSGVFGFETGSNAKIYTEFASSPEKWMTLYRIEQYYLSAQADSVQGWPDEWIISFKRHLLPPSLSVRNGSDIKLPQTNAKVLAFHGLPNPVDLIGTDNALWGKKWRYGKGGVPFVQDYWKRFS